MIQKDDLNNTTCFFGAVAGLEPALPLFLFCYVSLQVKNISCIFAPRNNKKRMYEVIYTGQFKKSLKLCVRRGLDIKNFTTVLEF